MDYFPQNIDGPSWGMDGQRYKPQYITDLGNNYQQSRAKVTRSVNRWDTITWKLMPISQYNILAAFFDSHQGTTFYWVHPTDKDNNGHQVTYTVRFTCDQIKYKDVSVGMREVTISMAEA